MTVQMTTMEPAPVNSPLMILDQYFLAEDDRFLEEWDRIQSTKVIVEFMSRWLADDRPWARQQIVRYLQQDLNFAGHEVFVKRLFRHFEAARDHQMMGHLMVAMDRIVRRSRRTMIVPDTQTGESIPVERLFASPNKTRREHTGRMKETGTGKWARVIPMPDIRNKPTNRLFRQKTRNYLRRRVWRYFRWLSVSDPDSYLDAITDSLLLYQDADFQAGENIIDNWSLMHACYFSSKAIHFSAAHANLTEGHWLGSLVAAPWRPELWQRTESFDRLVRIVCESQSSLTRIWAIELLKQEHPQAIRKIRMEQLIPFLSHQDAWVQQFGLELFQDHTDLGAMPVCQWLELIIRCESTMLPLIFETMKTHLDAACLQNSELLQLATAQPAPVAEYGFEWLQQRHQEKPLSVDELITLSVAACEATAESVTSWALQQLDTDAHYSAAAVIAFFDSQSLGMRSAAMNWLEDQKTHGHPDPVLWSMLTETPYEDVRLRLVECLHHRSSWAVLNEEAMIQLCCSVLLGVHRGGRSKLKAMTQIQSAILASPARAASLLPVLSVAVRSLRAPERRSALAAVATLIVQRPELQPAIRQHLPELEWTEP